MFHVYVLKSDEYNRIYIGQTSDVATRVAQHNSGKVKSTKPYCPWRLIYSESYAERSNAISREQQMKKSGLIRKQLKDESYNGSIV